MTALRFLIPRSVADALAIEQIGPRVRAANVQNPRLEYNTKNPGGQVRLICARPTADFILREIRALAERAAGKGGGQLLVDCAMAIANVERAIVESQEPARGDGSSTSQ